MRGVAWLLVTSALCTLGCRGPAESLVGTWTIDVERLVAEEGLTALPPEVRASAEGLMAAVYGGGTVRFDGATLRREAGGVVRAAPYVVRREQGDVAVLEVQEADGRRIIRVEVDDSSALLEEGGRRLPLRRRP